MLWCHYIGQWISFSIHSHGHILDLICSASITINHLSSSDPTISDQLLYYHGHWHPHPKIQTQAHHHFPWYQVQLSLTQVCLPHWKTIHRHPLSEPLHTRLDPPPQWPTILLSRSACPPQNRSVSFTHTAPWCTPKLWWNLEKTSKQWQIWNPHHRPQIPHQTLPWFSLCINGSTVSTHIHNLSVIFDQIPSFEHHLHYNTRNYLFSFLPFLTKWTVKTLRLAGDWFSVHVQFMNHERCAHWMHFCACPHLVFIFIEFLFWETSMWDFCLHPFTMNVNLVVLRALMAFLKFSCNMSFHCPGLSTVFCFWNRKFQWKVFTGNCSNWAFKCSAKIHGK